MLYVLPARFMMQTPLTFIALTLLQAAAIQTADGLQELQYRGISISSSSNLIRRDRGPGDASADSANVHTDADAVNANSAAPERDIEITPDDEDKDVTTDCTTLRLLDGNVCEQSCFRDTKKALHDEPDLKEGDCAEIGYTVVKASAWFMIFMDAASTHPTDGEWAVEPGCKMYYLIKHGVCENFCVREDKPGMVDFVKSRDGIKEGLCFANHYPRYVGRKNFTVFINPGVEDGTVPDPLEAGGHKDHHKTHDGAETEGNSMLDLFSLAS